jgi:hypothetical protein
MIIVTAPIALTEVSQPLFPLAWKAKNLGADSYIYSATHVAYDIKPEHSGMLEKSIIAGIVAAGGDILNLPLFLEIDPTETCLFNEELTWLEYATAMSHIPTEVDNKFYLEATDGQTRFAASVVIASGLDYLTIDELKALQVTQETN